MCEKNENPKSDTSSDKATGAEAAGVGFVFGLAGLVFGTLIAGPVGGIAFALIWGGQAALCAATGHEVDSNDIS